MVITGFQFYRKVVHVIFYWYTMAENWATERNFVTEFDYVDNSVIIRKFTNIQIISKKGFNNTKFLQNCSNFNY